MNINENPWFQVSKPVKNPLMRLFCFPYAGGSAYIYQDWFKYLPVEIEVIGVQYPGRGMRFTETPITNITEMLSELEIAISPYLDKPFAFFGHSNGGLISFELGRLLQSRGIDTQKYQFISAKRAIHLPHRGKKLHALPQDDFIKELVHLGGTPEEMLKNPEIMALFIPVLKADFAISETFNYSGTQRLNCNASLLYGEDDKDIPEADILKWHELINGTVQSKKFDGHHFFINSQKDLVLAYVNSQLKTLVKYFCCPEIT